jgi:D-lyxose ketol-isomerase
LNRSEYDAARLWAWEFVRNAGIPLLDSERDNIEIADLGLRELEVTGLQILTLASCEWLGAKLLILRPNQFFPQHRHPPSEQEAYPGKTELLRGQHGEAYLYVAGRREAETSVCPPAHRRRYCTVWHEVSLLPGHQHVCAPNTWHWFQAGQRGAVIWSISSKVTDAEDEFTDPQVVRLSEMEED